MSGVGVFTGVESNYETSDRTLRVTKILQQGVKVKKRSGEADTPKRTMREGEPAGSRNLTIPTATTGFVGGVLKSYTCRLPSFDGKLPRSGSCWVPKLGPK